MPGGSVASRRLGSLFLLLGLGLVTLALGGCGGSARQGPERPRTSTLGLTGAGPIATPGPPPVLRAAVGLSDEAPAAFASPYLRLMQQRLGLRLARLIIPFDTPGFGAAWLPAVRALGLEPYLTLAGDDTCVNPPGVQPVTGNCPPPGDAAYVAGFQALVRAFPDVRAWGAWNEPSNYRYWTCAAPAGSPVPARNGCRLAVMSPERAATLWGLLSAADRLLGRNDTIVAGENGDGCEAPSFNLCPSAQPGGFSGYLARYLEALGPARPRVWGTHSYHDLQRRPALQATDTEGFMAFLNARAGSPEVWLTEEGPWLGGVNGALLDGHPDAQADAIREFLALPAVPSAHPGQITREYLYLLRAKGGTVFDSALLDVAGRPRSSFCALLAVPASECPGNPNADQPAG